MNTSSGSFSKGHISASSGAALALICFFLPWYMVSCQSQSLVKVSGWDLAAGKDIYLNGYYADRLQGSPILFMILICALLVPVLTFLAYKRRHLTLLDSIGPIALSVIAFLVMLIKLSSLSQQVDDSMLTTKSLFGFWGVILGLIVVIVGGVLNFLDAKGNGSYVGKSPDEYSFPPPDSSGSSDYDF